MGVSRRSTQPVQDVLVPLPWWCTSPYSSCKKIPLMAGCSKPSGGLPIGSFQVVNLLYKALKIFRRCVHCLCRTYMVRHHLSVQVCTAGVQKFRKRQRIHRRGVVFNKHHSEMYTKCLRYYRNSHNVCTASGRCMGPSNMEFYSSPQWVYKSSIGSRAFSTN